MHYDFAHHQQILLQEVKAKHQVEVIDARHIESRDIIHVAKVGMMIRDHGKQLPMFIQSYDIFRLFSESLCYDHVMLQYCWHLIWSLSDHKIARHIAQMHLFQYKESGNNPWTQFIPSILGYSNPRFVHNDHSEGISLRFMDHRSLEELRKGRLWSL